MPLIVDLAKLGNKHQAAATFHNLQTKGPRREAKAEQRSTSWSTGVTWDELSEVKKLSTKAADQSRSLLAKWIQKWQKSEAYRWKKNTSSKSCPARLREGNTLVWLGFILAVARKHPSHFFQSVASMIGWCAINPLHYCKILWRSPDKDSSSFYSVASTISWCAIKPLYFCKILWRSPDKDGSSTSFSEVCTFWPDQHPS